MVMRYYSIGNGGLPDMDNTIAGSVTLKIKAALVTGYGGKPAAGWELLYESMGTGDDSSVRIVVRSRDITGDRMVYQFVESGYLVLASMATDWDDINKSLIDERASVKWYRYDNSASGYFNRKSKGFGIIADERSCWFAPAGSFYFFGTFNYVNSVGSKDLLIGIPGNISPRTDYPDERYLRLPIATRSDNCMVAIGSVGERYNFISPVNNDYFNVSGDVKVGYDPCVEFIRMVLPSGSGYVYAGTLPAVVIYFNKISNNDEFYLNGGLKKIVVLYNGPGSLFFANDIAFAIDE